MTDWLFGPRLTSIRDRLTAAIPPGEMRSPFRGLKTRFLIACTSRSGSTLLAQKLLPYGAPVREYLHYKQIVAPIREGKRVDLSEYCARLVSTYTPHGIFGVKGQFQLVVPLFLLGEFPAHIAEWRMIYLRREDLIGQAVSTLIAEISGAWRSNEVPARTVKVEDYDRARLADIIGTTLTIQSSWEKFFSVFGIEPLRLTFEDLVDDVDREVERAAAFLELHRLDDLSKVRRLAEPDVEVQASDINRIWVERFRNDVRCYSLD